LLIFQEVVENTEDGAKVNGLLMKAVRFADDQAMMPSSNAMATKDNRRIEQNIKRLRDED